MTPAASRLSNPLSTLPWLALSALFHVLRGSSDHLYRLWSALSSGIAAIAGNVDYLTLRGQLTTIDELLETGCIEKIL